MSKDKLMKICESQMATICLSSFEYLSERDAKCLLKAWCQNFSVRDVDFSPIFRLNLRKNRFVSFSETLKKRSIKNCSTFS